MFLCKNSDVAILFVHVWKGGGTSVSSAIARALVEKYGRFWFWKWVRGPFCRSESPVFGNEPVCHLPACDLAPILRSHGYGESFSFGVVRCPWARLVSMYHFTVKNEDAFRKRFGCRGVERKMLPQEIRGMADAFRFFAQDPCVGFRRWLQASQRMAMGSLVSWPIAKVPQSYWYYDGQDHKLVDKVYYLDAIDDLKVDLSKKFNLNVEIKEKNVGSYNRDISKYFDDESLAFVDRYHAVDIERFSFKRPF